jgi:hypothetical protein
MVSQSPTEFTQIDRDMLAWYLGRGLTPDNLKQANLSTPDAQEWARSPLIAPHIQAFHEINEEAQRVRQARARIDGYAAVSEALQAATTVAQKLHAVHALIRLNISCAAGTRRPSEAPCAPRSTSAPASPTPRARDPYANFHLPPLTPLGPSTDQSHQRLAQSNPQSSPIPAAAPLSHSTTPPPARPSHHAAASASRFCLTDVLDGAG